MSYIQNFLAYSFLKLSKWKSIIYFQGLFVCFDTLKIIYSWAGNIYWWEVFLMTDRNLRVWLFNSNFSPQIAFIKEFLVTSTTVTVTLIQVGNNNIDPKDILKTSSSTLQERSLKIISDQTGGAPIWRA